MIMAAGSGYTTIHARLKISTGKKAAFFIQEQGLTTSLIRPETTPKTVCVNSINIYSLISQILGLVLFR